MKKTLANLAASAALVGALVAAPADAYAAKDFSFTQTKARLIKTRGKLVNWCEKFAPIDGAAQARAERDGTYNGVCGDYWNAHNIGRNGQDANIIYQVTRDTARLQTVEAWVFRFEVNATTGAYVDAVLVDVTTHTDATMSMKDPKATYMEVVGYSDPMGTLDEVYTHKGSAWTGRSISGAANKSANDVPSVPFGSPLYKVMGYIKDLHQWAKNEYRY